MKQTKPARGVERRTDRYESARGCLLAVAAFTLLNVILSATGTDMYFLFSASIPLLLMSLGSFLCGRYPEDFYTGELEGMEFLDMSFFWVMVAVAVAISALYFVCWYFSHRRRVGFMIAALVLFATDTLLFFLFYGIAVEVLIDLLFHVAVLVYLILGVVAYYKQKRAVADGAETENLGDEDEDEDGDENGDEEDGEPEPDTPSLRFAEEGKSRTLLEGTAHGRHIVYRRIGRVNELVIDGKVYDEYNALIERDHMLSAVLDGHVYLAGFEGVHSYISVDGEDLARKIRWI